MLSYLWSTDGRWLLVLTLVPLAESLVVAVLALVVYLRHGRSPRVAIDLTSSEAIPTDLPPALAGVLWRHGRVTEDLMVATLLDLVRRRVVRMDAEFSAIAPGPATRNVFLPPGQTFRMTLRRDRVDGLREYEREVVLLLFDELAGGADSITVDEYRTRARGRAAMFYVWLHAWERLLRRCPEMGGLLRANAVGGLWVISQVFKVQLLVAFLAICFGGPFAVAPVLAFFFAWWVMLRVPGATQQGAALLVRYRALRRRLKDTRIARMPPPGLAIWDDYFVMAVVFGLAEKTVADLYVQTPGPMQKMGLEISSRKLALQPGDEGYDFVAERAADSQGGGHAITRELEDDLRSALASRTRVTLEDWQ